MTQQEALRPLDPETIQILVDNHKEFRRFLLKRIGNEATAEDLLQQSMLKALGSPPDALERLGILSWFYHILKNTLIDHYRSQAVLDRRDEELLRELDISDDARQVASPDDLKTNLCRCMAQLLPTLKPEYAEVLRRVDFEEAPLDTVASDLGITSGNLNVRLHRARQAFKKSLERTCGTCTEHGCLDCTCDEPRKEK